MVILENVQIPEGIKAKALSIDEQGFDFIAQIENSRVLYVALYTRPDRLEKDQYGIIIDGERDLFLYGVVFNEDGAIVTRQEKVVAEADFNMREYIQISAVFQYECPARLNKQAQIDAVREDLNRLLDADSETGVECHGFSISKHKSEAEVYSAISSIDVTLPSEIPNVVSEKAKALNPETFVEVERLPHKNAFVARYLNDQNLRYRGQSLINCGADGRVLKGIVIKADGSIPKEAEAQSILLGPKSEISANQQAINSAKVLAGLRFIYEDEPDNPAVLLKDALCDLRHMCDVHGLSFSEIDNAAHALYLDEQSDFANARSEA